MRQNRLLITAEKILVDCLGAKSGERILIVTDDSKADLGKVIYTVAQEFGCEAVLIQMPSREIPGQEPPATVANAMVEADVIVCLTEKSMTHTDARIRAAAAGARIATMPGITQKMFCQGAITADYERVKRLTEAVAKLLDGAETARIEKDGHTLRMHLNGRKGVISSGIYRNPGESGNLPSGEAYIAPLETESEGETVIDGAMVGIGKLETPLHVTVREGRVTKIQGKQKDDLKILFQSDKNAVLCELGIGTNENAVLCGIPLEDEKVYGTVHIAFGTNTSFGGINRAGCHMDGIILRPTLYLDEQPIIVEGRFARMIEKEKKYV